VTRSLTIGAGQLGPITRDEPRPLVVERLLERLRRASDRGCDLIACPELALTTFFPRWYVEDPAEFEHWFEAEMPSLETKPLFDEAARLGIGFTLGYAELAVDETPLRRYNTQILVDSTGDIVGKYRKIHVPGHEAYEPDRPFQHAERHYFTPGAAFDVWHAFGTTVGMATCNDRRWPETYRVLGLQGAELILIGYNTPLHYAPDPQQNPLQSFHNQLVMQAGAYQNGAFVVGVAKGGFEEGVEGLAQSMIIAPSGQIIAQAITTGDELISAEIDLDYCRFYKDTLFDFDRYRVPEAYRLITERRGAKPQEEPS
jgi:predicted amidohydrolase